MPIRRATEEVRETVPLDAVLSRAKTVCRTAPKVLDPRVTSPLVFRRFGMSVAFLAVLLYATSFLWLGIALLLVIGVPYLVAKSSTAATDRSKAESWSRRD